MYWLLLLFAFITYNQGDPTVLSLSGNIKFTMTKTHKLINFNLTSDKNIILYDYYQGQIPLDIENIYLALHNDQLIDRYYYYNHLFRKSSYYPVVFVTNYNFITQYFVNRNGTVYDLSYDTDNFQIYNSTTYVISEMGLCKNKNPCELTKLSHNSDIIGKNHVVSLDGIIIGNQGPRVKRLFERTYLWGFLFSIIMGMVFTNIFICGYVLLYATANDFMQ